MNPSDKKKIHELMERLEHLEAKQPRPEEAAIVAVAREALVDEMTRLWRQDWLAVYRKGDNLDAVSMVS
jgi:hypothetical protein